MRVAATGAALAEWEPDKPINIIVPWGRGRLHRPGHPGRSRRFSKRRWGTPGRRREPARRLRLDRHQRPRSTRSRDGYTWTANAIANNATYSVTGLVEDTSIEDLPHPTCTFANVPVVSVNADAPYQDFGELLEAMESGDVTVGTAGVNSSGAWLSRRSRKRPLR